MSSASPAVAGAPTVGRTFGTDGKPLPCPTAERRHGWNQWARDDPRTASSRVDARGREVPHHDRHNAARTAGFAELPGGAGARVLRRPRRGYHSRRITLTPTSFCAVVTLTLKGRPVRAFVLADLRALPHTMSLSSPTGLRWPISCAHLPSTFCPFRHQDRARLAVRSAPGRLAGRRGYCGPTTSPRCRAAPVTRVPQHHPGRSRPRHSPASRRIKALDARRSPEAALTAPTYLHLPARSGTVRRPAHRRDRRGLAANRCTCLAGAPHRQSGKVQARQFR